MRAGEIVEKQNRKGGQLHAFIAIGAIVISTCLCFIPIFLLGLLKLVPNLRWRLLCTRLVNLITFGWNSANNAYIKRIKQTHWEVHGLENLSRKNWYLVIANHQSSLDIVVLEWLFNRNIPALKFFIKDQLKWIPLLGFSWWAMGCPFMKRYSKEYIARKPNKQGKDLLATQKAIELFKHAPAAVVSFVEGTRYNAHKSKQQKSPYEFLLKPKAGGIGLVISTMGQQFTSLLDVTILYSNTKHSLWDFLCRRIDAIKIHIRALPIPVQFTDPSLLNNHALLEDFRNWLNHHWYEKDRLIAQLKSIRNH
jgi:1-acyl-sn-glycerol-3-phosphate acyltransferase